MSWLPLRFTEAQSCRGFFEYINRECLRLSHQRTIELIHLSTYSHPLVEGCCPLCQHLQRSELFVHKLNGLLQCWGKPRVRRTERHSGLQLRRDAGIAHEICMKCWHCTTAAQNQVGQAN